MLAPLRYQPYAEIRSRILKPRVGEIPLAARAEIGRIRRVYVRPAWRNKGIGRALVTTLVNGARKHFCCIRLRAENADAARPYEGLGFEPTQSPDATHVLFFDQ